MKILPHATDTSTDAESVQLELIRRMPPSQRLEKALALIRLLEFY
jgi:hypothetical protein